MSRWICFNHQKSIIFDSSSNNPRCPECHCADIGTYSGNRPPTPTIERKDKKMEPAITPMAVKKEPGSTVGKPKKEKPQTPPCEVRQSITRRSKVVEVERQAEQEVKPSVKKARAPDGKPEDGRWF